MEINPQDFFKNKVIGGKEYTIQPLKGWDAWLGWNLILKTVAPVFGEVMDSRNINEEAAMFEKQNTFREILTIVSTNMNDPEVLALVVKMLKGVCCDGESIDINEHFKENVHHMMELVWYATEVNFKGFFTESDMFPSIAANLSKVMTSI